METHEGLLSDYFEQIFRELEESDKANWLQECAQMVAQMVLRGRDAAIWAAMIRLGKCEMSEN